MGWKKKKKEAKGSWKKQSAKETKESREGQNWEGELWQRLKTLNKKFKTISDANIKK